MTTEVNGAAPAGIPSESGTPAAAQPNAATTNPQTDGGEGGEGSPVAERTFTQKELDEIIRREKAKTEAKTERRVLRTIERFAPPQQSQQAPQQQQAQDGKPLRSQFASEDDYFDARDAWRDQQKEMQALGEKTTKLYAEAEKLAGFDKDAFDELPLTKSMVRALVGSDVAAQLMHHLAGNPEEVERISKLPAERQAAAIGKLEAKLEAEPPKAARSSKAPDPITPIGAGNTAVAHDLSKLPMDKYIEQRKKQGARWAN